MVDIEFGIPFFRYHLDSKELKDIALRKNSNYNNFPINQTPRGWDCNLKTEFSQSQKVVDEYSTYYDGIIKQFSDDVGLKECRCYIDEAWLNLYSDKMDQEEHDHAPGFYSGIHYIKFDSSHGATKFRHPMYNLFCYAYKDVDAQMPDEFYIPEVEEGDVIIFPSFMRHRVAPNHSENLRITMAFNINTIKGSTRRVFRPE